MQAAPPPASCRAVPHASCGLGGGCQPGWGALLGPWLPPVTGLESLGLFPLPLPEGSPPTTTSPPGRCPSPQGTGSSPPSPAPWAGGSHPGPLLPLSQEALPSRPPERRAPSEAGPLLPLLPAAALTPCRRGGSLPLSPRPGACGTDPSLPSCSSPPYLLSSPLHPPTRRETLPARRHGNTRHRQGSPAPPPLVPPQAARRPPCCGADRARPRPAPGKAFLQPPGAAGS